MATKMRHRMTYSRILALGFLIVIVIGGFLLMLPISTRSGEWTNPIDALFTSTSATCVTGLILHDTWSYWSLFGQLTILSLIQIGGLGFMTIISTFSILLKRRISLRERMLLMQSSGNMDLDGVITLIKRILIGTFAFEGLGALFLAIRFCPQMGVKEGLYNAVFHSVSAFCNAGFDIMGKYGKFGSFTTYANDPVVCITLMMLIIIGGIGFLVWNNVIMCRWRVHRYSLHSKIVLMTSAILILAGAVIFFFSEYNHSLKGMSDSQKVLASFFQSVTTRTAGFNTIDQSKLSETGTIISTVLMFIGGSPGSTAGGIKTTTMAVVLLTALASARGNSQICTQRKCISSETSRQACSIVTIYLTAVIACVSIICAIEPFTSKQVLFEVASAVGTVGLTAGITTKLSVASRIIIMLMMYFGRIGGLSFLLVVAEKKKKVPVDRPVERILIG